MGSEPGPTTCLFDQDLLEPGRKWPRMIMGAVVVSLGAGAALMLHTRDGDAGRSSYELPAQTTDTPEASDSDVQRGILPETTYADTVETHVANPSVVPESTIGEIVLTLPVETIEAVDTIPVETTDEETAAMLAPTSTTTTTSTSTTSTMLTTTTVAPTSSTVPPTATVNTRPLRVEPVESIADESDVAAALTLPMTTEAVAPPTAMVDTTAVTSTEAPVAVTTTEAPEPTTTPTTVPPTTTSSTTTTSAAPTTTHIVEAPETTAQPVPPAQLNAHYGYDCNAASVTVEPGWTLYQMGEGCNPDDPMYLAQATYNPELACDPNTLIAGQVVQLQPVNQNLPACEQSVQAVDTSAVSQATCPQHWITFTPGPNWTVDAYLLSQGIPQTRVSLMRDRFMRDFSVIRGEEVSLPAVALLYCLYPLED